MTTYKIRYGRNIKLGDYEMCRVEIEEEFDEKNMPDRQEALMQVARMVEGFVIFRKKYPHKFVTGNMQMHTALGD